MCSVLCPIDRLVRSSGHLLDSQTYRMRMLSSSFASPLLWADNGEVHNSLLRISVGHFHSFGTVQRSGIVVATSNCVLLTSWREHLQLFSSHRTQWEQTPFVCECCYVFYLSTIVSWWCVPAFFASPLVSHECEFSSKLPRCLVHLLVNDQVCASAVIIH